MLQRKWGTVDRLQKLSRVCRRSYRQIRVVSSELKKVVVPVLDRQKTMRVRGVSSLPNCVEVTAELACLVLQYQSI